MSEKRRRTVMVGMRVAPIEHDALRAISERFGLPVADLIREAVAACHAEFAEAARHVTQEGGGGHE